MIPAAAAHGEGRAGTHVGRLNAVLAAAMLLACAVGSLGLPWLAWAANAMNLSLLDGLFFAPQVLFPWSHIAVSHGAERVGVFGPRTALLADLVQWLVIAGVFGALMRDESRPVRRLLIALVAVAGVGCGVVMLVALGGATLVFDGP